MAARATLAFLRTEAGAGAILVGAAALGIVLANSPLADSYFAFAQGKLAFDLGPIHESRSLLKWMKDGPMAVFFFLVGLEIKHEVLQGELSDRKKLALPVAAALGGMIAPALIYLSLNLVGGAGGEPRGWPIPTATDIAFALAALAVVAPRAPAALRIFLLTLAIADDLGAVALIGVLFSQAPDWRLVGAALAVVAAMALLARSKRTPSWVYVVGLVIVWAFTLRSGLNPSLAGVATALVVPLGARKPGKRGVLCGLMERLHPLVAFVILPFFAFVAAGFSLKNFSLGELVGPLPLGIAAGLAIGKPMGVFAASAGAVSLGLARRPEGVSWPALFGAAALCGIGFTMSLFIGGLAFPEGPSGEAVKIGVIAGSLISTAIGAAVLFVAEQRRRG